eukprot:2350179-Pyramimonas_sp.AAC.1
MERGRERESDSEGGELASDPARSTLHCISNEGQVLDWTAVLIDFKAGWPEMSTGMGFPAHGSGHAPRILCGQSHEEILVHNMDAVIPHAPGAYEDECRQQEKWVLIDSPELHRDIRF